MYLVALPAVAYASGSVATAPSPTAQTDGEVDAIAVKGNIAYIGGVFKNVRPAGSASGGVARNGLAAIDLTTGAVTAWNPGIGGSGSTVNAIAVSSDGATIYVGGTFSTLGGSSRANLGSITSGGVVTSWNPGTNGQVRALVLGGANLYVGGNFTTAGGASRTRLAAFAISTGVVDPTWRPTSPKIIKAMVVENDGSGRIIAAGGDANGGVLQVLDPATGASGAWANVPEFVVDSMTVLGAQVFMGMGGPGGKVEGYSEDTGVRQWTAQTDGDVQAITARDGLVYAGGHFVAYCLGGTGSGAPFQCTTPVTRGKLLALRPTDGALDDWDPETNGSLGVFSMANTANGVAVGGQFTRWNLNLPTGSQVTQQGFAVLGPANTSDQTPPSTPSNLLATAASDTELDLSWTASTDNVGVDHYVVTRDGTTTFTTAGPSFNDTGLAPSRQSHLRHHRSRCRRQRFQPARHHLRAHAAGDAAGPRSDSSKYHRGRSQLESRRYGHEV